MHPISCSRRDYGLTNNITMTPDEQNEQFKADS
jgi:hypothetical protein